MSSVRFNPITNTTRGIESPIVAELVEPENTKLSWVFRAYDFAFQAFKYSVGIVSIIFCTAIAANIPVVQFLSFGYLLETSGRLARGGSISDAMVGISKAFRIGGVLLGTWILLIPLRFFSDSFVYESYLIDPSSEQAAATRGFQIVLIVLTLLQISAAWICGGKIRYFFWQLIAPFSFGIWFFRKMLGSRMTRPVLTWLFKWFSPNLVNDICNVLPPADWFVPAILWTRLRSGRFYRSMRDELWDFVFTLNLPYYFKLGFFGFVGTSVWLFLPTILLVGATRLSGVWAVFSGVLGVIVAIPVFSILLIIQTHFSKDGQLSRFWEFRRVLSNFRRAPVSHVVSLLLTLLFALPLFIAKIEQIPSELLWTLSLLFMCFSWPSRIVVGLAYRRGGNQTNAGRWWIRWAEMSLAIPIAAAFVIIFSLTRYISWHGALSMIENHVFLLPAPFWL